MIKKIDWVILKSLEVITKMSTSAIKIIRKWNKVGYFIKFKDGNNSNCKVNNLEYINFIDTFNKPYQSQRVDWDSELTPAEKKFVIENWKAWIKIYQDK
jgi:hypothetical protein